MSRFFDSLKTKLDMVEIVKKFTNLKRNGKDYLGLCPFHNEKTPSFKVSSIKNFFYCFGCHTGGDVISFYAKMHNMSYKNAGLALAKTFNIPLPRLTQEEKEAEANKKHISNFLEEINNHFTKNIQYKGNTFLKYLYNRGIDLSLIKNYQLGLSGNNLIESFPDNLVDLVSAGMLAKSNSGGLYEVFKNRITIPIRNQYGNLIGFGGRVIDDHMPKYLNSPETALFKKSSSLYGEHIGFQISYKTNNIFLVEGYFDCIMMHKYGLLNTVASLGTAITLEHLNKIWNHVEEIIICMDSDSAGLKAAKRVIEMSLGAITAYKTVSFLRLPTGHDPDSFLMQNGVEEFKALSRQTLSDTLWEFMLESHQGLSSAEDFAKLETDLNTYCKQIQDPILKSNFTKFYKTRISDLYYDKTKRYSKKSFELQQGAQQGPYSQQGAQQGPYSQQGQYSNQSPQQDSQKSPHQSTHSQQGPYSQQNPQQNPQQGSQQGQYSHQGPHSQQGQYSQQNLQQNPQQGSHQSSYSHQNIKQGPYSQHSPQQDPQQGPHQSLYSQQTPHQSLYSQQTPQQYNSSSFESSDILLHEQIKSLETNILADLVVSIEIMLLNNADNERFELENDSISLSLELLDVYLWNFEFVALYEIKHKMKDYIPAAKLDIDDEVEHVKDKARYANDDKAGYSDDHKSGYDNDDEIRNEHSEVSSIYGTIGYDQDKIMYEDDEVEYSDDEVEYTDDEVRYSDDEVGYRHDAVMKHDDEVKHGKKIGHDDEITYNHYKKIGRDDDNHKEDEEMDIDLSASKESQETTEFQKTSLDNSDWRTSQKTSFNNSDWRASQKTTEFQKATESQKTSFNNSDWKESQKATEFQKTNVETIINQLKIFLDFKKTMISPYEVSKIKLKNAFGVKFVTKNKVMANLDNLVIKRDIVQLEYEFLKLSTAPQCNIEEITEYMQKINNKKKELQQKSDKDI